MDYLETKFIKIPSRSGDSLEYPQHHYYNFGSINKSEKDENENKNDSITHSHEKTQHPSDIICLSTKCSFANVSKEGLGLAYKDSQIDSEYSNNNDYSLAVRRKVAPIISKRVAVSKSTLDIDSSSNSPQTERNSPRIFTHRSLPPSQIYTKQLSEKVLYSCEVTKNPEILSKSLNSSVITFNKNIGGVGVTPTEGSSERRNSVSKVSASKLNLEMINETVHGGTHSESEPASPCKTFSPLRSIRSNTLKFSNLTRVIDFQQALRSYNQMQAFYFVQGNKKLWKISLFQRICCRVKRRALDDTQIETCEKIIAFAYFPVSITDSFHKNLIVSSYMVLHNMKEVPAPFFGDLDDDRFVLMQGFELTAKLALMMFLNILFLDEYFPSLLNKSILYTRHANISLIKIIYSATEITIKLLREGRLNEIISKSGKCLEIIFFVFAGLFIYNITYQQMHGSLQAAFNLTLRNAKKDILSLVAVSKNMYQAEENLMQLY